MFLSRVVYFTFVHATIAVYNQIDKEIMVIIILEQNKFSLARKETIILGF